MISISQIEAKRRKNAEIIKSILLKPEQPIYCYEKGIIDHSRWAIPDPHFRDDPDNYWIPGEKELVSSRIISSKEMELRKRGFVLPDSPTKNCKFGTEYHYTDKAKLRSLKDKQPLIKKESKVKKIIDSNSKKYDRVGIVYFEPVIRDGVCS